MIKEKGKLLKEAEKQLSIASAKDKNLALQYVKEAIDKNRLEILKANAMDIENAHKINMSEGLVDRLMLDDERINGMMDGLDTVIQLGDPIWQSEKLWTLENGLVITRMSVPLGVIGIIYESRPNVSVDAFSLALKSGNCILLRGSSSAIHSNMALVKAMKEGLRKSPISEHVLEFVEDTDRAVVNDLLTANEYIDLIIPRGGSNLINFVIENASVPTLQTGEGNCHIFVDESANLDNALDIIINAKTQRLGVCNACETTLVHQNIANQFLPMLYNKLKDTVEFRGDAKSRSIIDIIQASEQDWKEEYLASILAVKVVDNIDEAIEHINTYGTKHSESIITESLKDATKFQREIDAAVVYVNASTRFTDGSVFGFGAEMGISTQKIHARGPVGVDQLVSYKYLVTGEGHIRG